MADKKGRINEIIQRNLSEIILYELKDPVTRFASVNECHTTTDYSYCKVYVSHIKPEKADELVSYLNNKKGMIRTLLAKKLSIYKTPELQFVKDVAFEKGQAMDDLIEHALKDKPLTLADLDKKEAAEKKKAEKKAAKKASAPKKPKKTTSKK